MASLSRIIFCIGALFLFHSGYSAVQHKSFLKLAEMDYSSLPIDITVECLLGSLLCCVAVLEGMSQYRDFRLTSELYSKKLDGVYNKQNFMIFNHRGSALSN
ncbi:PREDICTED: membrane magnesium transporter 1-like [Amphimedon queenslandica]|uniref:Membrane magnesium transporter n=2 Tax=Amphimedon queenslandica TaxID=400682 RepID=A0AAN0J8R2_AMPQE|nr:PREDICTED: membrane magnesium transporter 1-like [Amphimedon queenslandica]|eukprot:XP_019853098.1 PREDICTED: membrane magnesium transporter 1-like [Amphimedon queenslandica]